MPRFRSFPLATRSLTLAIILAACAPAATPDSTANPPSDPSATPGPPAGETLIHSIEVDGRARSFRLHTPAGLPASDGVPLVVVLHGGLGSAEQAEEAYGWNAVADREGFLVAYPDGIERTWNAGGGCCGRAARMAVDDVEFVRQVVARIDQERALDVRRRYAAGMSNGGIFVYRLACETDLFAAVGPVAATQLVACRSPEPTSVMAVHGLDDTSVRFDGEPGSGIQTIDGPPVPEVIAGWRRVGGCDAPAETVDGVVRRSSASCAGGRSVALTTVDGAGHQWPGSVPAPAVAMRVLGIDPPSNALDATSELWAFFEAHPRQ